MKDSGHRNVCALSQIAHCCNLGLGLEARHESACNPSHQFAAVNEGYKISLHGQVSDDISIASKGYLNAV